MCFLCAGPTVFHPYDPVPVLPTFSQMCPCSLLVGNNVASGGTHLIRKQHRCSMSSIPFHNLIWLSIFVHLYPLFSGTLCYLSYCFVFDVHLLPPRYTLISTVPFVPLVSGTLCYDASRLFYCVALGICPPLLIKLILSLLGSYVQKFLIFLIWTPCIPISLCSRIFNHRGKCIFFTSRGLVTSCGHPWWADPILFFFIMTCLFLR